MTRPTQTVPGDVGLACVVEAQRKHPTRCAPYGIVDCSEAEVKGLGRIHAGGIGSSAGCPELRLALDMHAARRNTLDIWGLDSHQGRTAFP